MYYINSGIIGIYIFRLAYFLHPLVSTYTLHPQYTLSRNTPYAFLHSLNTPSHHHICIYLPYLLNGRRTFPSTNGALVDLINISIKLSEIGFFAITPESRARIYFIYLFIIHERNARRDAIVVYITMRDMHSKWDADGGKDKKKSKALYTVVILLSPTVLNLPSYTLIVVW